MFSRQATNVVPAAFSMALYSSFPFVWHALVLEPVVRLQLRKKDPEALIRNTKGRDPMTIREVIKGFRAFPSECDYNMHKSSACLDVLRCPAGAELTCYTGARRLDLRGRHGHCA